MFEPDQPVHISPYMRSRYRTAEHIKTDLRVPGPGECLTLMVRRPVKPVRRWIWRTAPLSDLRMCNLYSMTTAQEAMRRLFDVAPEHDQLGNHEPESAIFPKHHAPVVRLAEDGAREMLPMHLGFLTPQRSRRTGKPIKPAA